VAAGYARGIPHSSDDVLPEAAMTQGALARTESALPPPSPLAADALIAQLAAESPGEIYALTLGALTNVGQALIRWPETASNLRGIITCGGRFDNPPVSIGWNLRYDPIAAATVSCSGAQWTLLSEGMMDETPLRDEDLRHLRRAGIASTELISEALDLWKKNKPDATPTPHLDDLVGFFYLMSPESIVVMSGRATLAIAPDRIAELWIEQDPAGPHILSRSLSRQRAEELRDLCIERLLSAPVARS
jgi:inosine-uridine nucleoside N-ribohydrolase